MNLSLNCIFNRLAEHTPDILPSENIITAAVALILRTTELGQEGLFIERATREGDPWSGNIGFPGGRIEPHDNSLMATAERETYEEVGLNLSEARYLARLSDIDGAHLKVRIACFVYHIADAPPLVLSDEVTDAFWVPIAELTLPQRQITAKLRFSDRSITTPAILLPQQDKPLLWGMTYRLVQEFIGIIEHGNGAES